MKNHLANLKLKIEKLRGVFIVALALLLAILAQLTLLVSGIEMDNYWNIASWGKNIADNQSPLLGIIIYLIAIVLLISGLKHFKEPFENTPDVQKKLADWMMYPQASQGTPGSALKFLPEWLIIAAWALWIGRAFLDMSPNAWPSEGKEYIMAMQNQYMWALLPKCGACFFWNGYANGGAPSFVDVLSGWLHPISILATWAMGVFNSGKIIILASLFMAGMGQWWLGKVLNLGRLTRVWTALVFVASGCLTGRMEIGSAPLMQGLAACSLVFPAILQVVLHGGKKATIVLGITLGLVALAGQGYPQTGLIFCLVPLVTVLLMELQPDRSLRFNPRWRNILYALLLGALIAAPLLVPLIHNSPEISKDTDPNFSSAQPLKYILLNLVIDDPEFYINTTLHKMPYGHLNINYIGWIPLILAITGWILAPVSLRKIKFAMAAAIGCIFLVASGDLLRWIYLLPFGGFASGMRGMGQLQGLVGPWLLVLAGIGIDELARKKWPQATIILSKSNQNPITIQLAGKWLVLLVLMVVALKSVADFSKNWLFVTNINMDTRYLLQKIKTTDAQWVQPPYGEYVWLPAAMENDLKINKFFKPWRINGPERPKAYLEMSNIQDDAKLPEYTETFEGYVILKRPNNLYASIAKGESMEACHATSLGGSIDVNCNSNIAGTLTVMERALSGWTASRDGQGIALDPAAWLTVNAPAGEHTYRFRYRPWDAPVGIILAVTGWAAAAAGWIYFSKKERQQRRAAELNTMEPQD